VRRVHEAKSSKSQESSRIRAGQFGALQNPKSVQEVSKQPARAAEIGRFAKTDLRYWLAAVFQQTYTRAGGTRHVRNWAAKIQYGGRRETFNLATPNKAAAASKAREIYLNLQSSGWDKTLEKFKSKPRSAPITLITVGEFVTEAKANLLARPKTVESYCRAFRMIVANIFGIEAGPSKYDYRRGGRQRWVAKIDAVKLRDITPEKVQKWKIQFIRRAGTDPVKLRTARTSANSLMRQAKSLFAPAVLKFMRFDLNTTPFEGVPFEPRQSMRYRSSFDVEQIITGAQDQLPREQLKIFLLAVMAGLRRNEIDKLEWSSFKWKQNVIRIETTRYLQPKSEDSIGDVEVDRELIKIFREFKARTKDQFVIESDVPARMEATYSHYRCERDFTLLIKWLRAHGVPSSRPLHALRKEYGSQVCAKHGIYAASCALRHSDIAITSQHYLDRRRRVTVGLGNLLNQGRSNKDKQQYFA